MIDREKQAKLRERAKAASYGKLFWPSMWEKTYDPHNKLRKSHEKTERERSERLQARKE